jgi:hypothetical protein
VHDGFGATFLGARVEVRSDIPATAAWLRELVAPAVDVGPDGAFPDGTAALRFDIRSDPDVGLPDAPGAPEACFALDHEVVVLPTARRGAATVVDDDFFRAHYVLETARVGVSPRPGESHHLRGASLRALRETFVALLDWSDRVQLHAAALSSGGRVALLAGARESGKTTLLTRLCAVAGDRIGIVANDRIVVSRDNPGWQVAGVPSLVSVRPGTLSELSATFGSLRVPADANPVMHTTAELAELALVPLAPRSAPLVVSLSQLASTVGVPLGAGGRLARIALLRRDEHVETFRVTPLSVEEATRRLPEVRFGRSTEPRPATVFERVIGGRDTPSDADAQVWAALAAETSCLDVAIGPGLLRDDDAAAELRNVLFDVD